MLRRCSLLLACCATVALFVGCPEGKPDPERTTSTIQDRLKVLALAHARSPQPPQDDAAFHKAVEEFGKNNAQMFERFHIASADEVFISPRDQQPFGLRFNVPKGTPGRDDGVVAYEASSSGGKRYVAFSSVNVTEIDDATFQDLVKE